MGNTKETKLVERTIRHKAFAYQVEAPSPTEVDKTVLVDRIARHGETVKLRPLDVEVGERHGAFETEETREEDAKGDVVAADLSDAELINTIKDGNLNANATVALADGDSEQAKRVLSAEASATGNDSRVSVVKGLEAVISRSTE